MNPEPTDLDTLFGMNPEPTDLDTLFRMNPEPTGVFRNVLVFYWLDVFWFYSKLKIHFNVKETLCRGQI
ncbi:hypothetical protein TYM08_P0444 [Marinicellulosiphila megalodicopiae]